MAIRVVVVIPGHLSTSPRLLKLADACGEAGYRVRVVSGSFMDWAAAADAALAAVRKWTWQPVEYRRRVNALNYTVSGTRGRLARHVVRLTGADRAPWWAVTRAYSRIYDELRAAALSEPCDVVVGGSVGGLAVAPEIAAAVGRPCVLDLEDLHTDESDAPDGPLQHGSARRILSRVWREVGGLTTASELMADAYAEQFGRRPRVVHNVFPLHPMPAWRSSEGPLRLYWFSQTIGPGRGLEDAVSAAAHADVDAILTLRGAAVEPYVGELRRHAARIAPRLTIRIEPPAAPDDMVRLSEAHDVGLSLEVPRRQNRAVCLTNKAFTYLPAGVAVAFSDTPGQRWLAERLGCSSVVYPAGEPRALGEHLRRWAKDRDALAAARRAARAAAVERWRWDHPSERGTALDVIAQAVA
jgi:hypothetical protein